MWTFGPKYDLASSRPNIRWIFSEIGFRARVPLSPGRDLTTRPPRPGCLFVKVTPFMFLAETDALRMIAICTFCTISSERWYYRQTPFSRWCGAKVWRRGASSGVVLVIRVIAMAQWLCEKRMRLEFQGKREKCSSSTLEHISTVHRFMCISLRRIAERTFGEECRLRCLPDYGYGSKLRGFSSKTALL
ncbi:hypothetical protein AVEN_200512-1 [Araneus ventricosus]|uniref:Uncharacterized protein n=1 Tax=Araneus ventricosus TaxID=182803 RepID=A0A4Y2MPU3_ARAVE|nr:hypothetical protein AVEN_200512-1 [Araneus ventricosus]